MGKLFSEWRIGKNESTNVGCIKKNTVYKYVVLSFFLFHVSTESNCCISKWLRIYLGSILLQLRLLSHKGWIQLRVRTAVLIPEASRYFDLQSGYFKPGIRLFLSKLAAEEQNFEEQFGVAQRQIGSIFLALVVKAAVCWQKRSANDG